MSLAPGVRLGAYEVIAFIGAGGMGEVYRARDTRLGRDVAIKVLPAALSVDPERLLRFEQEARAASALSHPNICSVHDIGAADSIHYIVSELLEGETLRERLAGGAIPVRKAVEYAVQIAHGLAAAHDKGIVHRDLKPDNIFVTSDGRVKILDFGLAKLVHTDTALAGGTDVPTTPPLDMAQGRPNTQAGLVLGTMGYMAPEQVRGLTADHHADIFAFGVVLYEMLSGQRAFQGQTAIDTMTAILKEDPADLPLAERHIPPTLARIVDRCLEKNPAARFQTASDLGFALEALSTHSGHTEVSAAIPAASKRRFPERLAWATTGAVIAATIAVASMIYFRGAPASAPPIGFTISAPPNTQLSPQGPQILPAVSPDGRRIVFTAGNATAAGSLLWVRSADALEPQMLVGTNNTLWPFWSPDSRTIAFFQTGKLRTIDAAGGPVQTVCDAAGPNAGGTWNRDGTIVFGTAAGGLFKVPATGGQPTPLTKPDASRRETSHRFPWFLPDGRHFLYTAFPTSTIWIGSLDGAETTKLLTAESQARYAAGHLLFTRQGTLLAQPFDAARLALTGDVTPIAERVQVGGLGTNNSSAFSASENGTLVYRVGASIPTTQLTWVDRSGKPLGPVGEPNRYRNPGLSPDETWVGVEVVDPSGRSEDIWLIELARGVTTRFTFDPGNDVYPTWSPDGTRVMFASDRQGGRFNLYQKPANGSGNDELVFKADDADIKPYSWSPDGNYVVYIRYSPEAALGVLPLVGDRQPLPPPPGGFGTSLGQVSPDGRWMAYGSTESGRYEVYVRSFPKPGGKWQISKDGAVAPRWRGDGKELFYYAADGQLVAVPIQATDKAIDVGTATSLFAPRLLNGPTSPLGFRAQYDVTRDGQRFLLNVPAEDTAPPSITVVVNWPAALKK